MITMTANKSTSVCCVSDMGSRLCSLNSNALLRWCPRSLTVGQAPVSRSGVNHTCYLLNLVGDSLTSERTKTVKHENSVIHNCNSIFMNNDITCHNNVGDGNVVKTGNDDKDEQCDCVCYNEYCGSTGQSNYVNPLGMSDGNLLYCQFNCHSQIGPQQPYTSEKGIQISN